MNAADRSRYEKNIFRLVGAEPIVHGGLVSKVDLFSGGGHQIRAWLSREPAHHRRTDEAAMSRNENSGRSFHEYFLNPFRIQLTIIGK